MKSRLLIEPGDVCVVVAPAVCDGFAVGEGDIGIYVTVTRARVSDGGRSFWLFKDASRPVSDGYDDTGRPVSYCTSSETSSSGFLSFAPYQLVPVRGPGIYDEKSEAETRRAEREALS